MSKNKGNFEDLFEQEVTPGAKYSIFDDEESKFWIHRTFAPTLYFNPGYIENNCPMIITQQELDDYFSKGKNIFGCASVDFFYSNEEYKRDILQKLSEKGVTLDDFEFQLKNKLLEVFESYFLNGLYMPDVYGTNLERTAHQYSIKKMKRIIGKHNFGFNNNRGEINAGIILEIPLEDQQKIYEELPTPIESGTQYYGNAKISKVVSPKFIKGMVVKFGDEVFYIQNPNFQKQEIIKEEENREQEKELYLYHTEELITNVLDLYQQGDVSFNQLMENYLKRMTDIYKIYRYYALREPGFVMSDRNKEITAIFGRLLNGYELPSKMEGIEKQEYYQSVQNGVNDYLNNKGKKI